MPVLRAPASHLTDKSLPLFSFKHLEPVHLRSKWLPNLQLHILLVQ